MKLIVGLAALPLAADPVGAQATGPAPRVGHTAAYHAGLGMVVVFGGRDADGADLADLWGWDGRRWHLLDHGDEGPTPRSRHAMAYDRSVDRLVIHGGGTVERDLGDAWAWTPDGWTGLGTAGPGPRSHHVMAYHPPSETLVLYGGGRDADGFGSDTWILNDATWRRSAGHLRPGRVLPGMVAAEDRILLFGGLVRGGHRPRELWGWRDHAWTLLDSDGPAGRIYPGLAWHAAAGHVILFGGEGDNGYLGVTWVWNGSNWSRRSTERDPPPRTEHTLTYDRRRDIVVLFGGRSADGISDALWEWDGRLWSKIR